MAGVLWKGQIVGSPLSLYSKTICHLERMLSIATDLRSQQSPRQAFPLTWAGSLHLQVAGGGTLRMVDYTNFDAWQFANGL